MAASNKKLGWLGQDGANRSRERYFANGVGHYAVQYGHDLPP